MSPSSVTLARAAALALVMTALAVACTDPRDRVWPTPPWVKYDDNTGLVGQSTEDGSLAGTWGLVIEWSNITTLPIFGDRYSGAQGSRLLTRTWNGSTRKYTDSFIWCSDDVFEVEGTKSNIDDSVISKLARVTFTSDVDHAAGKYQSEVVIDNWGVRNMPDAENTPLPDKDNYKSPPQSDWMWDVDEDGHPGFTARLRGALTADAYNVSRSVYTIDGTVLNKDRVQGLARSRKSEQKTVDGTTSQVAGESRQRNDPNPKNSWFDMARLREGATCDDVKAAMADGRLSTRRPF